MKQQLSRRDQPGPPRALAWRLFAFSFVALFLELMIIRWSPSVVRLIAYYANLMLISSFLGLGVGTMLSSGRRSWPNLFPLLLLVQVGVLVLGSHASLPGSSDEGRFFLFSQQKLLDYAVLVAIFASNAAMFVPLGHQIGNLFQTLPPLNAYSWDLGGSLAGTLCFGVFSFTSFSPLAGMSIVIVLFLLLTSRACWSWSIPVFALVILAMFWSERRDGIWSPYYFVTVRDMANANATNMPEPPADLRTMTNPPSYVVSVNQDFYQPHRAINPKRYEGAQRQAAEASAYRYFLPYLVATGRQRVAVVGAGGGCDVEAALLMEVQRVDAVEIDPVLVKLSRKFNAADVYGDPRVHIQVDDGRAFLRRAEPGYDLVVFGWLDSQALFSHMSNLRLDGYIYTVESMRSAYELLAPDGVLSLSFSVPRDWLALKLVRMLEAATGKMPIVYVNSQSEVILFVPKGNTADPPPAFGDFKRGQLTALDTQVDIPTDDWPYLYLARKTVPSDYLVVIGVLLVLSLAAVFGIRGKEFGMNDAHFLFLGLGFLLLETKSIGDSSLYFGTTWLVTLLVVAGVLIMVLAANLVALRLRRFTLYLYLPLFFILAVLYFVPREFILAQSLPARALWTLLAVPLPVFFAGLIFSATFRKVRTPAVFLGANLIGAMLGGFVEYLGMFTGNRFLTIIVIAAYAASFLCRLRLAGLSIQPFSGTPRKRPLNETLSYS